MHLDESSRLEEPRDVHLPSFVEDKVPGAAGGCGHHRMPRERQESSGLLLSPGGFWTVLAELLFQAGQEVAWFPRNPDGMSPPARRARGHVPAAS